MSDVEKNYSKDILCPYCQMYYTLEEIFIFHELSKGNMDEEFICEMCGNKFLIQAKIEFDIKKTNSKVIKNETIIYLMKDKENID